MRTERTILLGGILLASLSGAAHAQGGLALTTRDVNLRMQPTTYSPSLGIIPGGSTIQAGPCGGGWCQAFLGGQAGFVSQLYLDFGGPPVYGPRVYAPAPPPPPVVYGPPPPPVYVPAPVYVRPRPWWW
ncbi:MAG TPA: hypothetical protein VH765_01205 [Xanthobacteraceae bacterium]|jgi:uncharacterized protein YraI